MGLDVAYYAEATRLRDVDAEWDSPEGEELLSPHSYFPRQADGLERGIYAVGVVGGHFAAGPYSAYNRWRDQLARLAGYASAEAAWREEDEGRTEGPFWELINFSDCEGIIGASTSAKLARDFAEHQAHADAHDERFRDLYSSFRVAFETAAKGGVVKFT